jgi:S1-C subfamily serine protease
MGLLQRSGNARITGSKWRMEIACLGKPMRFVMPMCLCFIAAATLAGQAHPQGADQLTDADQSLRLYTVHIIRVPKESWTGYGVYLGNGLVLTASHVVGSAFWNSIKVDIAGQELPAKIVKEGSFRDVDLALLSIDDEQLPISLRLRRMPFCKNAPAPGEEVIVAIPEGIARSHVVASALLPRDLDPKFRTAISDVATTGNSGSGVFDAGQKCLLGIISAKIRGFQTGLKNGHAAKESKDIAKYFVPAVTIAAFIPPELRF